MHDSLAEGLAGTEYSVSRNRLFIGATDATLPRYDTAKRIEQCARAAWIDLYVKSRRDHTVGWDMRWRASKCAISPDTNPGFIAVPRGSQR